MGSRSKNLWKGILNTKQERQSMLYDEFDRFRSEPGESIHSYYLSCMDFLKHNEKDAKEVREMPTTISAGKYLQPTSFIQQSSNTSYAPTVVQQPPTFQHDTGLAIPTFLSTDDPIASLNKAMIFLSLVYRSKFPPTNNQLRTSLIQELKLRFKTAKCYNCNGEGHMAKQCIAKKKVKDSEWFKDKMLLAQAQEAGVVLDEEQQDFLADSLEETNDYYDDEATTNAIFMANLSPVGSINGNTVEPRYDSDILSESYDELKGDIDVISYTDYMLTIGNDKDNYVPPPVKKNDMMLSVIEQMKSQVEKCNMVNKESKRVNESLTSELKQYKEIIKLLEYAVKDGHLEQEAYLSRELYSGIDDSNKKKIFETLKQESSERYEKNISEIVDLENAKKELENIVFKVGQSAQTMHMLTKPQNFYDETHKTTLGYQNPLYLSQARRQQPALYNGNVLIAKHNPVSVCDSDETLILAEESRLKMLEKQTVVNTKLIDYSKLNKLYEFLVPQTQLSAEKLYWSSIPSPPFDECIKRRTTLSPHDIGSWDQSDIKEVNEMKDIFKQIEDKVDQCFVAKKSFEIEKEQLLINNDRILEENITNNITCTYLRSLNEVDNCRKLRAQLKGEFSESQMNHNGTSVNTKLSKPSTSGTKLYSVTPLPKSKELLEEAKSLKPLDEHIGHASKFADRIQELVVYVSASCSFTQSGNEKWAPAKSHRKNNKPYMDASRMKQTIKTITQKHVVKQNTRKTDNTMLPSIGRVSSTNASGSKPKSNTKNDRILKPSSRSKTNKVEAHHRKFKYSANKNNHVSDCNANVKNVALLKNYDTICLSCNECLFSANHDACVVQYLKKMQKCKVAKSA
ncbi:retrovirus-related pol polyprotein from transposon TNT 1-94 [Tanacetum coccineum]